MTDLTDIFKFVQTFQARLRRIMDASLNATDADSILFTETLDNTERVLFSCGQRALADFLSWESREMEKLTSSEMVTHLKKRKRYQTEDNP